MESWDECSAPHDTSTVRVSEERRSENKKRIQWWPEANWPSLKDALVKSRDPNYRGRWDVACLDLGIDRVPRQTIFNVLRRIGRKPITYENFFPDNNRALLSNWQVKCVEDIIIKRDTANLGMSRKEVIQVISELGQAKSFVQAENHLDYLIRLKRMTHLKRIGRVVSAQATLVAG